MLDRIKDGTARWYVIDTQNLEEYGENYHKFKGGSTYVVSFHVEEFIWEENAYGEGEHSYYHSPSPVSYTHLTLPTNREV